MDDTVTTGLPALDVFLGGGIPHGFTVLLLAPTGSGAETFCKQFAQGRPGSRVTYVTTDESEAEVHAAAERSGWDFEGVRVVDVQSRYADELLRGRLERRPSRPRFDPRDLVEGTDSHDLLPRRSPKTHVRTSYLERLLLLGLEDPAPDRLIIDSLDFYFNLYDDQEVVATLQALDAANAKRGSIQLWVLAKGAQAPQIERRLELMADCIIELEVNRRGASFERYLMVRKVKNRSHGAGVSTYALTPHGFVLETLERIT